MCVCERESERPNDYFSSAETDRQTFDYVGKTPVATENKINGVCCAFCALIYEVTNKMHKVIS
jgi:hypothetical protein